MDYNEIRKLVKLVESSGISSLEIGEGELSVRIEKHGPANYSYAPQAPQAPTYPGYATTPGAQAAPAVEHVAPAAGSNLLEIKAPMVGTFYEAPGPDKAAFVKVGDRINPGQTMCILEAMKIMNEIEAEVGGRIVEILVKNGQPVQFDQILFRIEP